MNRITRAALAAFLLLLGACASQAYRDGRELIAAGRVEEGVLRLAEAVREDPQSREIRATYLRQRELAIARLIGETESARAAGALDAAEPLLRRALALDPANARALAGIEELASRRRLAGAVRQAEELLRKGDLVGAEARARTVLAEAPLNAEARALMRRIEEQRAVAAAPASLGTPFTRPITLELRDTPLRSVFETMARLSGVNFIFDRDVRQDLRVTIFVRNTSIDEVMRLILSTNQLERKLLNESSVLIYPNTPAKAREHQDLALRTFYLTNIDTKQAQTMIRAMAKTRDLYADEKLNAIIVRDTPDAIRLVERLLASIDLPEPEVMLEIEVMEIASTRVQEIGLRWPSQLQFGELGAAGAARLPLNDRGNIVGNVVWSVANPVAVANLRAEVGSTNTLANPRIRVRNREKARVHIGDKLPVFTTTSTANVGVSASVSYLDVGLKLDVEPAVYLDNEVAMKVALEVSNVTREVPGPAGSIAYQIGTRLTNTVLRVKDGETQVLAGLISDEDRTAGSRVPGLGDLPIIGRLFGSSQDTRNKTEIVLLITPRVLRNLVPPQVAGAMIPAGTESSIGAAPLRLATAPPRSVGLAPSGPAQAARGAAAGAPSSLPESPQPADNAPQAPGAAPPAVAAVPPAGAAPVGASGPLALSLAASGPAQAGREFGVSVSLAAGSGQRALQIDLAFDPAVLEPIGQASDGPGRATLTVQPPAPGAAARFRVIGPPGASATIGIAGVRAADGGASEFVTPPPLALEVTQ
ncbi:MAG: secretin N-terminal domain-containing protein [Burkholderiales bacterium]